MDFFPVLTLARFPVARSERALPTWLKFAQELLGRMVLEDVDNHKIGGYGVVVQLDESKFGKRKYRGHRVEGV